MRVSRDAADRREHSSASAETPPGLGLGLRVIIDPQERVLIQESSGEQQVFPLDSPEAFQILSRYWLEVGWTQKYSYGFCWLGRPIIQLPEDLVRLQEVIHHVRPDVIIETGVAHGGSLILSASLCKALDRGRVIGIDIRIRPENRAAIEKHPLAGFISLLEGSSIDEGVVSRVKALVRPGETVLVILDSCHTKAHVLAELRAYSGLVSPGSYIVATDGIMGDLAAAPGAREDWLWDNPREAALEFARERPEFVLEEPPLPFNEGSITQRVTYWPSAFLRRAA
jgi:cephalosporin hydroxylase